MAALYPNLCYEVCYIGTVLQLYIFLPFSSIYEHKNYRFFEVPVIFQIQF